MQRLVFNPKAYAFIKTTQYGVVDVSDYIIRGSVNRRVNAVSSANLTLQNPDSLFTKNSGVRFTPMDPITIYLQRTTGFPVRTFTGYLDSGTYYQLLPGPVELKASCTLKKLQNTYFDPALQYTQDFLAAYGWIKTGESTFLGTTASDDSSGGTVTSADFQGAAQTAEAISKKNYPYAWGGGHPKCGTPSKSTRAGESQIGYDCSGYVAAILAGAGWGFKKGQPVGASGSFANWGKPGRGKELTVWYNSEHIYIVFEKGGPNGAKRADTSPQTGDKNMARGPHLRYNTRSNDGFTPRHWDGH